MRTRPPNAIDASPEIRASRATIADFERTRAQKIVTEPSLGMPVIVITGPTASGKSALALEVARSLGSEIVACDSMQVYRGCDIVTAKPTNAERALVSHHCLDLCDPSQRPTAVMWALRASAAIDSIRSRGKVPIVCGGTGFYLRALLQPERFDRPASDPSERERFEALLSERGAHALHAELERLDPSRAAAIAPRDAPRLLRALESLSSPTSSSSATPDRALADGAPMSKIEARIWGLEWPRAQLIERIEARIAQMIEQGALEETRALVESWGPEAPALGGIGYKRLAPLVTDISVDVRADAPDGLALAAKEWAIDTRRYAKRQMTWFRHQCDVRWLPGDAPPNSNRDAILRALET